MMKCLRTLPLLALCLLGCNDVRVAPASSGGSKMIVAKLDTLPILQQDPAYQELAQKYATENIKLLQEMERQLHEGVITKENAGPAYMKAQAKLNDK